MESIWPWLAVAGAGALHGLNPATGWVFAAARGLRSGDRAQALRALLPIAAGHTASVALVAAAAMLGMSMDRATLQLLAGALFLLTVLTVLAALAAPAALSRLAKAAHLPGRACKPGRRPTGQVALALWSCMMSTVHGAGLMLVPALIPLCLSDGPARQITATGSLALAMAAVCVHTGAMLAAAGLMAMVATLAPLALPACRKIAQPLLDKSGRNYGIVRIPSHLWLRKHGYLQDQRTALVDDRLDHAGRGHQLPDTQHAGRLGADAAH